MADPTPPNPTTPTATPTPPTAPTTTTTLTAPVHLPRLTITYCTQCRWLLRAAWLQQELLSTFSTAIGEIALVPSTGGIFRIHLMYIPEGGEGRTNEGATEALLWDRKAEGGFPEAKVLKQRVRDCVQPGRGLGHSDSEAAKKQRREEEGGGDGDGKGEGKEGLDLAAPVREKGPANPLAARMRPGGGGGGEASGGGSGGGGVQECEDCK